MSPIRLANGSIYHGALLSSPAAPTPLPGQIEHVILCSHLISPSHPVTEDSPLLQWRERERERAGKQIWTHVPAHTPTRTRRVQTNRQRKPHACEHVHTLPHIHSLTSALATTRLPLIFKYSRASISLRLPFSVIFLPSPGFFSSSSQPFLCSLSILTGVCSFRLSLQSIGHI